MALNAPYTPNTVIQSTQVSNDLTGLANGSNDTSTNSMSTYRSENNFDFVASGCVWSGDSYGGTRNASQTAGVVYLTGVRLAVALVTGRLFTASKDTYIDINSSGVQVYTEVTNNAASPALTVGNMRIGIIVTGATTIAAAGSVNQGQETIILPIASSIPYAVTDSLGNLICCRDVNRKILGLRIITADVTTTSSGDMTGLNLTVLIPTGRKVRVSGFIGLGSASVANDAVEMVLVDVTAGANIASAENDTNASGDVVSVYPVAVLTPTVTTKNYKAQIAKGANAATVHGNATATNPNFILVELM